MCRKLSCDLKLTKHKETYNLKRAHKDIRLFSKFQQEFIRKNMGIDAHDMNKQE